MSVLAVSDALTTIVLGPTTVSGSIITPGKSALQGVVSELLNDETGLIA